MYIYYYQDYFIIKFINMFCSILDYIKFVGSFRNKQDLIDVVEVIYRGVMKGKVIVISFFDLVNVLKYEFIYKDI